MTENVAKDLLVDSFGRVRELVVELTDGLTEEKAAYRPDPDSNSISWLLWHLTRIQDDHLAGLTGGEQAWPKWRERFDLPFSDWDTGWNHRSEQVAAVRATGDLLAGYHADVHALTSTYLDQITPEELDRVVDTRWDPPVTASVRLVSILGDVLQHLGQAAYVEGLAGRRARSA